MTEEKQTVELRYTRALDFRTVHADGVYGGITPARQIRMEFFVALPKSQDSEVFEVKDDRLGERLSMEGIEPSVILREKQVSVVMSFDAAKALLSWLKDKVEQIGKL